MTKGLCLKSEFKNYIWFRGNDKDITIKKTSKGYGVEVVIYYGNFVEKTYKDFSLCKDVVDYLKGIQ